MRSSNSSSSTAEPAAPSSSSPSGLLPLYFSTINFITEVFGVRNSNLDHVPYFSIQTKSLSRVFFVVINVLRYFLFFPRYCFHLGDGDLSPLRYRTMLSYHLPPDPSRLWGPCGRPPLDPRALAAGVRGLGRPQRRRSGPAMGPSFLGE